MRFCIPIEFKAEGGGYYFLRQLDAYLRLDGHSVTSRAAEHYDVLFTNHWLVPLHVVLHAIRHNPHVRVVQRIDGAAADYGRTGDADRRQHDVNRLADLTIFQSHYCRWSTREKFPVIANDGPVIHNPVDVRQFTPDGDRRDLKGDARLAVVSWSLNPKKGAASVYAAAHLCPATSRSRSAPSNRCGS